MFSPRQQCTNHYTIPQAPYQVHFNEIEEKLPFSIELKLLLNFNYQAACFENDTELKEIMQKTRFPNIPVLPIPVRGSCKKFCHWVRFTSVLRFIKHIFITNLQSIPPLLKHIFVSFLPSCNHHHIIIGFLINMQVQGQHPHQWAPFQIAGLLHAWQISHQISRYIYHEG